MPDIDLDDMESCAEEGHAADAASCPEEYAICAAARSGSFCAAIARWVSWRSANGVRCRKPIGVSAN
jgi:hypothetical protein